MPGTDVRFAVAPSIEYSAISEEPPIRIVIPRASHSIILLSCEVTSVVSPCSFVIAIGVPGTP